MYPVLRRPLLAFALALATTPAMAGQDQASVAESELVISSGIEGGGYWSAASRLQAVASDMRFSVAVQASTGSLDNLTALTDSASPVNLAFAQADALQYFLDSNEAASQEIDILENIGQECVFIVTSSDHPVDDIDAMQDANNYQLGIASADSGVAVTFNYMTSQLPGLSSTQVQYGSTANAMDQLGNKAGETDAIMVVHRPREHSAEVDRALQAPEDYRFVEIEAPRLTRELPDGQKVYQAMNLAMPGTEADKPLSVKTICVKGLLVANRNKLSDRQRDQLSELVNLNWMKVYVTK